MSTLDLSDCLPASVELAAGSGKTWTLADTVRRVASDGGRVLVLTHTVAGVHAMSSKLHEFDIDPDAYHVATLMSLAIELVSAYSSLAGFDVPETVDLERSEEYLRGSIAVLKRRHIRDVFSLSYTHALVDEYQDCSTTQHDLVRAIKAAIPQTAVFGDRLQGIFGFRDPIVDWAIDVLPEFPNFPMNQVPRRWQNHNKDLGAWLLGLRHQLVAGNVLDLSTGLPNGVTFVQKTKAGFELDNAARQRLRNAESVVVITAPNRNSPRKVAARLSAFGYVAMEEVGGSFMTKQLKILADLTLHEYATWLANTAKYCFTGYGKLDKGVLGRLEKGQPTSTLSRPGFEKTLAAIDRVQSSPELNVLARAMDEIRIAREARLHSREAWHDMTKVIEACGIDKEREMLAELVRVRERVRHGGRGSQLRVVSRTVLIKGLEYDHVIVANVADLTDACNLYVALSRARMSVTIIGPSPQVTVTETKKGR